MNNSNKDYQQLVMLSQKNDINFQDLMEKFIGGKYFSFKNSDFNIWALLFGNIYLGCRKMYLYCLLLGLLKIFLIFFYPVAILVINISLGFLINKIYLAFVERKVKKIIEENINSKDRIDFLCNVGGGKSILSAFLTLVFEMILIVIFSLVLMLFNITPLVKSDKYFNGVISYNNKHNIYDVFKMNVPDDFKVTSDSNILKATVNTNLGELYASCRVSFSSIKGYSSSKNIADKMKDFYSGENYIVKNINGITWYSFRHNLGQTTDIYVTEFNNKVYLYQYTIEQNANKDLCSEYNAQIINSILLK